MCYYLDRNTGFLMNDSFDRTSFNLTIHFIDMWATKMEHNDKATYNFEILHNICQFWKENEFVTKRQYDVLKRFWFKWRIYKTTNFYSEKEGKSIPTLTWFEDTYDYIDECDRNIGFPEDSEYPPCLKKPIVTSKCVIDIKPKYASLGQAFNNYSPSSDKKLWY